MRNNKFLSIVIPAYNVGKKIDRCLNSIFKVDSELIEVIVIDDGSTDDTVDYLNKYSDKITVIRQSNKGVGHARNAGILEARGKYIWFVDADDEVKMSYEILQLLKKREDSLIMFGYNIIDGDKKRTVVSSLNKKIPINNISKYFDIIFDELPLNTLWNKFYLRETIENEHILFNNFKSGEDALFNYKFIDKSVSIYIFDKVYYTYYLHSNNTYKKTYDELRTWNNKIRMLELDNLCMKYNISRKSKVKNKELVDILFGEELNIFKKIRNKVTFKEYKKELTQNYFYKNRENIVLKRDIRYQLKYSIARSVVLSFYFIKNRYKEDI